MLETNSRIILLNIQQVKSGSYIHLIEDAAILADIVWRLGGGGGVCQWCGTLFHVGLWVKWHSAGYFPQTSLHVVQSQTAACQTFTFFSTEPETENQESVTRQNNYWQIRYAYVGLMLV